MTLGEFYCKGLSAPVVVEIKRDDVVFARVYDIRGKSIASLLAIPAPRSIPDYQTAACRPCGGRMLRSLDRRVRLSARK
jgi:hypothetical protein